MLKFAYLYQKELLPLYNEEITKERAKYYQTSNMFFYEDILSDTSNVKQYVSVSEDNKIHGYIEASINKTINSVDNIAAIRFEHGNQLIFHRDLIKCIISLLQRYNKINLYVATDNPNLPYMEKIVGNFEGDKIGLSRLNTILEDGTFHDVYLYEILSDNIKYKIN